VKKRKTWIAAGIALVVIAAGGVGLWEYHEQPQFCATCHVMEPYLESWEHNSLLANTHAQEDIDCLECHEPTIQQQVNELVAFVTNDYEVPLKELKVPQEECLACHEHGSYDELVEATAYMERNPHDSHYGEMECRLCHKMHKPSVDYCSQCHEPLEIEAEERWTTIEG